MYEAIEAGQLLRLTMLYLRFNRIVEAEKTELRQLLRERVSL
jgi:hypothetical protein